VSRSLGSYLRRHHIGLLALFVALGGTAYAAAELPRDSVGSKQLRKGAVRTSDIRARAVTLGKLNKAARRALKGQVGPRGADGAQGPAGQLSSAVIRFKEFTASKEDFSGQYTAKCNPGEVAVGGGAGFTSSPGSGERLIYSGPVSGEGFPDEGEIPDGWDGSLYNSEPAPKKGRVYVVCAK